MPNLVNSELNALRHLLTELSVGLSLALSEQINQELILEMQDVTSVPMPEVLERTENVLSTLFSLSPPLHTESLLLLSQDTACLFADLLEGRDGSAPAESLTDEQLKRLSAVCEGGLRSLTPALANQTGESVEIEQCNTQFSALTLPPVFAMESEVIQAQLELSLTGFPTSTATFLLTPTWARALLPTQSAELPATASLMPDALSEDELAAMLNDIGGMSDPVPLMPGLSASAPPFSNFPTAGSENTLPRGMELIMDIPLDVTVELGRVRMLIKDVLELASGSIVELDRVAGEPVDLLVNGRLVAKGEVVVIEDNFGIRITEIVSQADRLAGLGKAR